MSDNTENNPEVTPDPSIPVPNTAPVPDLSKELETRRMAVNNPPIVREVNDVPGSKPVTPSESVSS